MEASIGDLLLTGTNMAFNILFVPSLLNKDTYIPRLTSSTYVVGLIINTIACVVLGIYLTAITAGIGSLMWLLMFLLHGKKLNSP